jgi:hypothetical protein
MPGELADAYIRARRVLLDTLEALQEQRQAVLLVGAQAISLHTGAGELAVQPYTSDADLVLNPDDLTDEPRLEQLLTAAGFRCSPNQDQIGTWIGRDNVPVDLMVPEARSGRGRRSADLGVHGNRVARKARGLEGALVDNTVMTIGAFEPVDPRRFDVRVAGPAALLVAKLHKVWERRDSAGRRDDKDALDVYRLLELPTDRLATPLGKLLTNTLAGEIAREAVRYLRILFGSQDAQGVTMVLQATEGLEDADTIASLCVALADDLLNALT